MANQLKKKPPVPSKKPEAKPAAFAKVTETKAATTRLVSPGHNSIDKAFLKSAVGKIENIEESIRGQRDDVKDIYAEAKAKGLNPTVMRKLVALRRKQKEKLREEKEELELYLFALDPELADVLS